MNKKESENKLLIAQVAWETFDSLGDKIMEETIEGVASDALSSIPGGTIAMGVYKGIKNYKERQRFNNFIIFVKSYKTNTETDITKYLQKIQRLS